MYHCINMNDTPGAGPITEAEFEALHRAMHDDDTAAVQPAPAEAATDVGQDVVMPYDGIDRAQGWLITLACFAVTVAVIAAGVWLKN